MPAESIESFKYYAFISYSHADKHWADWLHKALETYRVPKRLAGRALPGGGKAPARLFPIFRDREELPVSADLGGNIKEALRLSRNLVVICSPRAAQSLWVNEEIRCFKGLGRGDRVQCLIVAGEPNATDKPGAGAGAECFPAAVRYCVDGNGELTAERTEPIAADARPGMDGKGNATLKLLAGILGVNFDELKQRERVRRRKRMAGAVAAVLMLGAGAIGIWQFQAAQGRRRLEAQEHGQEAAQEEEQGREELLAGHATEAVKALEAALAIAPEDRPATRLMLGVARRQGGGLRGTLEREEGNVTRLLMSPDGKYLLAWGNDRMEATLWDLETNAVARKLAQHGGSSGQLAGLEFNSRSDKLLLARGGGCAVLDVATGVEAPLAAGFEDGCFLGDGSQVLCYENHTSMGAGPQFALVDTANPDFAIFDSASGRELRRFDVGAGSAGSVQADPSGETAIVAGFAPAPAPPGVRFWAGEPRVKWFDIKTGRIIADLPRRETGYCGLSPDGKLLLYQRADGTYEMRSKEGAIWSYPSGENGPAQESWSRGGRYALLAAQGTTSVLEAATGKRLWGDRFWNYTTDASDSYLAYADTKGVVRVRELATGRALAIFADRIGWPDLSQFPLDHEARFTPDGQRLILAGSGDFVKIWDWRRAGADRRLLGDPAATVKAMAAQFSPDGATLAVRKDDNTTTVWDVATGTQRAMADGIDSDGGVFTLAFSPDGTRLLGGALAPDDYHAATVWEMPGGSRVARLDDGGTAVSRDGTTRTRSPMLEQHIRVAWGRGRLVTVNFNLGLGCLWDGSSLGKVGEFSAGAGTMEPGAERESIPRVAMAAAGDRFVVAGFDGVARVFGLQDGKQIAAIPFPGLNGAELSDDGATMLTRDGDSHAAVWSVAPMSKLAVLNADAVNINEVHLSGDGRMAAAACSDYCVRLWDARTGELVTRLKEEAPPGEGVDSLGPPLDLSTAAGTKIAEGFLSVQFDPHGRWVAGINELGHLCVWEIPNGRQLVRWKLEDESRDACLTVSPDGNRLALTGQNGAAMVFDLTLEGGR